MRVTIQPGRPVEIRFGETVYQGWSALRIAAVGAMAWVAIAVAVVVRMAG